MGKGRLFWAFCLTLLSLDAQDRLRSMIVVYRADRSWFGSRTTVYCDSTELAKIGRERFFLVVVPPGRHYIRSDHKGPVVMLDAKAGERYYVEVKPGGFLGRSKVYQSQDAGMEGIISQLNVLDREDVLDRQLRVYLAFPNDVPIAPPLRPAPLTNLEVITLVKQGMNELLIIRKIRESTPKFELGPERLIELRRENVSEMVIGVMMDVSAPKRP